MNAKCSPDYASILRYTDNGKPLGFNGKIKLMPRLNEPLKRKKPTMYFVNSMSDLFHKDVPFGFLMDAFMVMREAGQHTFQILTKRPERILEFAEDYTRRTTGQLSEFPNVWLGVSVENQRTADERIPYLLKTPAAIRFLSCEPLLEKIDLLNYILHEPHPQEKLDWIIIGCESGKNRRECKIEWVESIVNQFRGTGVKIFIKQLSINGKVEKDIKKFPSHLQVREYPI